MLGLQRVCTEFVPIATVVVDEGSDLLESLECERMLESGVWGVSVEVFPVVTIVADKVGDCAKDLILYGGVWRGHGFVLRRGRPVSFYERKCEDGERRMGCVKVFLEMFSVEGKKAEFGMNSFLFILCFLPRLTFSCL